MYVSRYDVFAFVICVYGRTRTYMYACLWLYIWLVELMLNLHIPGAAPTTISQTTVTAGGRAKGKCFDTL